MAVCSKCGTSVPDDAKFCSGCGQLISIAEESVVRLKPQQIDFLEKDQTQEEPQNTNPLQGEYSPLSSAVSPEPQQSYYAQPPQASPAQPSYYAQPQQTPPAQPSYYAQPQQAPPAQPSYYAQPQQAPPQQQSYYAQPQQNPPPQQSYYAQPQQTPPQQSYYAQSQQTPPPPQSYYAQPQQTPPPQQSYYAQQGSTPQQNYPQQPNNYGYQQQAPNYLTGPADIEENKGICVLSYLGLLMLIPLLSKPNSAYVKYHSNQGLVLLILGIIIGVLTMIPYLGWFIIGPVGYIFTLVCVIMGIINTVNGQMKPLPLIGAISLMK